MSENKYIIDKDSLTGIADAVRDKLGVGSSIDDENAGYYPATGYILKFNTIQKKIAGQGTNVIFSMANGNEQIQTWCGKVPEKIKFTRASNPFYTTIYCNGAEVIPQSGSSKPVEKIISYPTNGTITVTEYNGLNSFAVTPPAITIEFLDNDENSLRIINGDTSFSYDGQTISFLTGSYNAAIPFTLNDIQTKITNMEVGIPPLTTVPTFKLYSGRSGGNAINLSSQFSTQEEMLKHLVDIVPGAPGSDYNILTGSYNGDSVGRYPICKDKYGRWISMKKLGITIPLAYINYGYSSPVDNRILDEAHNNDLTFCFGNTSPFDMGTCWIAIIDRYILLGYSNYLDVYTNWYSAIVEV